MANYQNGMTEHEKERLRKAQEYYRSILNQECETCGAEPGWMCFTRSGGINMRFHVSRTQVHESKSDPLCDQPQEVPRASQAL